ncbi:glycosyltransferase [Nocardia sp. NBC_01503]|uniref:glycosyltransferase family 2 protein n=1 Tax=Nocardia sp. NBC_01503 TaxID=2975997 RepID=UPI002E7BD1EB|nr:glycosyltransferase [Nocardia sp. NBC_01503]WTL31846.1 glycosyltransferase [Nocardia sp. NBC_01503]
MANLSVCVPVHDSGRTVGATLRSILEQDNDFQVIVLDNASTDDTVRVANSFHDARLRVVRNTAPLPIGENWNKAVSLATGRLVKVVCAGDILLPGSLAKQVAVMGDQGIAVCASKFQVVDADGRVEQTGLGLPNLLGQRDARTLLRTIVRRGPADFGPTATSMFRRMDFERVGGFRGDLALPMDVDLIARVSAFGLFYGMSETLVAWRDSRFNRYGGSTTAAKFAELLRFQHRLGREYPQLIGRPAVLGGDLRLVGAVLDRVRVRAAAALLRRPALLR